MNEITGRYFTTLIERLEKVRDTQGQAIDRAAETLDKARALAELGPDCAQWLAHGGRLRAAA